MASFNRVFSRSSLPWFEWPPWASVWANSILLGPLGKVLWSICITLVWFFGDGLYVGTCLVTEKSVQGAFERERGVTPGWSLSKRMVLIFGTVVSVSDEDKCPEFSGSHGGSSHSTIPLCRGSVRLGGSSRELDFHKSWDAKHQHRDLDCLMVLQKSHHWSRRGPRRVSL